MPSFQNPCSLRLVGFGDCDEHIFRAVIPKRLAGKAAVQRLHLQARDVDQRKPFILGGPPKRASPSGVKCNVDPVLTDRVTNCMRDRLLPVCAIKPHCDSVIEGEGVPGEPPAGLQRRGDPFEGTSAVGPSGQVQ